MFFYMIHVSFHSQIHLNICININFLIINKNFKLRKKKWNEKIRHVMKKLYFFFRSLKFLSWVPRVKKFIFIYLGAWACVCRYIGNLKQFTFISSIGKYPNIEHFLLGFIVLPIEQLAKSRKFELLPITFTCLMYLVPIVLFPQRKLLVLYFLYGSCEWYPNAGTIISFHDFRTSCVWKVGILFIFLLYLHFYIFWKLVGLFLSNFLLLSFCIIIHYRIIIVIVIIIFIIVIIIIAFVIVFTFQVLRYFFYLCFFSSLGSFVSLFYSLDHRFQPLFA